VTGHITIADPPDAPAAGPGTCALEASKAVEEGASLREFARYTTDALRRRRR